MTDGNANEQAAESTSPIVSLLRNLLELPETRGLSLDDPSTTDLRLKIIKSKPFLRRLYDEFYGFFEDASKQVPPGLHVEVGSGAGFLKEVIPQVITSEVLKMGDIDLVYSGEAMPFPTASVSAFYLLDVLHHIPNPESFLREATRCLKPSGRIVMIEPYNTPWARFIYQNIHHEPFDPDGGWTLEGTGPLSDANGALPWILFERDKARFEDTFPQLNLLQLEPFMPFSYILSGGVSMRSLLPGFAYPLSRAFERMLTPFANRLGMFAQIQLKRVSVPDPSI